MEVNKPSDFDAGVFGAVKTMALRGLADSLKAKIAAEQEEKAKTESDLKEIE